ncbi:NB-ARC - like 10 [Theobroma cacao]|nr:NB-ARC - like 10 [Theobroma cacao]
METLAVQAAGQAAGSLVTPAVEGGKGIFNCLQRKYAYVKNIKENIAKLETEESRLDAADADVKTELERNKLTKEKTNTCEIWLKEVEEIKQEIETLKSDYRKTSTYLCGLCPFTGLLKLGKCIVRKTTEVVKLKNQRDHITIMVEKPPAAPIPIIEKHPPKIDDVPSLNSHVERLVEWLEDENLKKICIWGPPGVGKTTIMEHVHNRMGASRKFDIIFWVNVTAEGRIRNIQDVIWERLDMKMDGNYGADQRAKMISDKLKDKRYVLFLDLDNNLSEIKLREVGIHDEHKHGKVVFACRYKNDNICGDTDEELNVQRLSKEDAGNFFWKVVGSHLKSNPDIKPVAELIINECGGLPQLIKLIGNRLAEVDDPAIWRDMLLQLRSPTMEPLEPLEEVYKAFKIIYERLTEEMKPCLLYWAVFPAGYEIFRDHIIDCWRAEKFFLSLRKLPKTRDRGHAILDEFLRKSLLEKGRKWGHFKMYEYFQRVALRIANLEENFNFFVTEDENIIEEEWERARRVSLIRVRLSTLPKRPQCCGILTLIANHGKEMRHLQQAIASDHSALLLVVRETILHLNLVLKQAKAFELIGHQTASSLSVFPADKLQGLEACIIEECNEMESIIDRDRTGTAFEDNDSTNVEFERLKSLHINNLPKLTRIWQGSIESKSLCRLTTLTLKGCHRLQMLFSQGMIIRLSQLQKLQVEDCGIMKEIIEDGITVESHAFPKLKNLQLRDLPELCSICHVSLRWPSLETILIKTCMKIRNLPHTMQSASKLRIIQCTEDWWNQQDWPNNINEDDFREFLNFK